MLTKYLYQHIVRLCANVDAICSGLPGYEDIPCPKHTALLLAPDEDIAKYLVNSNADINYGATTLHGFNYSDNPIRYYSILESSLTLPISNINF